MGKKGKLGGESEVSERGRREEKRNGRGEAMRIREGERETWKAELQMIYDNLK